MISPARDRRSPARAREAPPRRKTGWNAIGVLSLAALLGCTGGDRESDVFRLTRCESRGHEGRVQCGRLLLPEDPSDPNGTLIPLGFQILRATGSDPAPDPLLVFVGGPGQSATEASRGLARLLAPVLAQRDVILVDQRGTGRSNRLDCAMEPARAAEIFVGSADPRPEIRDCVRELQARADLTLYHTSVAVDDFAILLDTLGYQQVNLWGSSYGSRAALVFLRQHPGRVRSVVLHAPSSVSSKSPLRFCAEILLSEAWSS